MSPSRVIPKKPKPPKTTTTTTPAPTAPYRIGSYGNTSIDQWDNTFRAASLAVQKKRGVTVDPRVLKGVMDIETGGDGDYSPTKCRASDGFDNVPACGPMQIKWPYHSERCRECNRYTVAGQVEMAAHILGMTMLERKKDEYDAITAVYFPGADINGTTQAGYLKRVRSLVKAMEQDANGTTPAVPTTPAPAPQGDVIDLLYGGKPYDISAYYGQLVTWSCPGCYDYQAAYGLDTRHHYAYDISAHAGDGAPLYAPFDGLVVCAGTGVGSGAWNTGCAAFDFLNNYGARKPAGAGHGRIELLNTEGTASLIVGHALSATVRAGQRVKRGDLIGYQGGMNGSHVHLEGRYASGTRIGDPRKLFGGGPITVTPERIPYDWSDPNLFTVKALKDLKVYQRADPASPVLDTIPKGDTFSAVAIVPGNDKRHWYLGVANGRVPVDGTEEVAS